MHIFISVIKLLSLLKLKDEEMQGLAKNNQDLAQLFNICKIIK